MAQGASSSPSAVAHLAALLCVTACTLSAESTAVRVQAPAEVDPPHYDVAPPNTDSDTSSEGCRPLATPWGGGQEPLRLPCERTEEPCDLIDNDLDGFIDPHCPTIECNRDADCTYGGLLPDADCNFWGSPHPVCNQIDGFPRGENQKCWGVLCPSGTKCVQGDCVAPGTFPPNSFCTSGSDCPLASGCIPLDHEEATMGICTHFCHDFPCPDGYICTLKEFMLEGEAFESRTCRGTFGCANGFGDCAEFAMMCMSNDTMGWCACLSACEQTNNLACVIACLTDPAKATVESEGLAQCLRDACDE